MERKQKYTPTEKTVFDFSDAVFRLAMVYVKNRDDAEDVCQEVFLRLFRRNPELESEQHCKNWLFKACVNCCKTLLLKQNRALSVPLENAEEVQSQDRFDDFVVSEAVSSLSPKQRAAIHLFYYEELGIKEIAKVMGITPSTVTKHLQAAKTNLRTKLKGYYYDD